MKKIFRIFDLRNGDLVVFFGREYCHTYNKENIGDLESAISEFKANPEATKDWDGNELEFFTLPKMENDETVDEVIVTEDGKIIA